MTDDIIDAEVVSDSAVEVEPITTECAFLVYLDETGHWMADSTVERGVNSARVANVNDFLHAAAVINKDIVVSDTVARFMAVQQQMAQAMMQRQQASAAVPQDLRGAVDLSTLRI